MRVARRPPWRRNGSSPHEPTAGRFKVPGSTLSWPDAGCCVMYRTPPVVQVFGYMDELIDSEHLVVHREHEVYASQWLEVVDMDDWLLWRITGDRARQEMARVRRGGTEYSVLYLGCFRAVQLDRDTRDAVKHRAKVLGWYA